MPPKKQKKPPKNAFFFYMMHWKEQKLKQGCIVPGPLNLLANAASPDWQSLSENEKKPFLALEKKAKEEDKQNLHNKFTTNGISYAQIQAEEKEEAEFLSEMKREITNTLETISKSRDTLLNHKFYFIHANHYCYWHSKGVFIPCEVAIAEYSLKEGISDVLHFFPAVLDTDGGRLPVGYMHEALEIAKRTHQIPMPRIENAEDYDVIAVRLCSFLQKSGSRKLPPLYTRKDSVNCNNSMSTVKDFLKNCQQFCEETFRCYDLADLFYELRNKSVEYSLRENIDPDATEFPTLSLAETELDRDIFHFAKGISCEYHEELSLDNPDCQVSQFCSKSAVQRWGFLISDYCCHDVGVQLKVGKHCPKDTDVAYTPGPNDSWTGVRATSEKKSNEPRFVDAPPPAVNSWRKGPPKIDSSIKVNDVPCSKEPEKVDEPGPSAWRTPDVTVPQLDGCRLPKTRGRGERLIAVINRLQLGVDSEDFPALGAGRGRGRV